MDRVKGDQRILGDSTFVMSILEQANQELERTYALRQKSITIETVAEKVAAIFDLDLTEIFMKSRIQKRANASGLYCYWAVHELGMTLSELADRLSMTPAGVSYAVQRGETIARQMDYEILS